MKGISMIFVVFLVFVLLIFSSFQLLDSHANNVFTGQAKGENGLVKVAVTIKNNQIEKITILENHESDFTAIVFDSIPNMIIKSNSPNVDGVSGATVSSNAIMEAVKDAVRKSGVSLQTKKQIVKTVAAENTSTDIVIIGAGGAGLAAAIQASKAGAKVIVVEKNSFIGGNTNYANGMNAAGTSKGRNYTPELFYEETMKGGHYLNNPDLVKVLAYQSEEAAHWIDSLKKVALTLQGNHLSSMDETAFGAQLIRILNAEIKKRKLDVRLNTKAVKILLADNAVTGIRVQTGAGHAYTIHSKAVVIASGGFGANQVMVTRYNPKLKGFATTNQPGATGDAFGMVEKLGISLVDMNQIQTHPTVLPTKHQTITEGVRGAGAILINRSGKRFVDETETRDTVSEAILRQKGKTVFLLFDSNLLDKVSALRKNNEEGVLTQAATLRELAAKINVNETALVQTVEVYNSYVKAQKEPEFGRKRLAAEISKSPYYAVEVEPAIHYTMGGIKINTATQVINTTGNVVKGLFAAGEVTGGVHGANRLGGNAITDIIVFGRIAGRKSAEYVKTHNAR